MSSKRGRRRKACQGKVRHETKEAALKALVKTVTDDPIRAYLCHHCKGWHVGHPPRRQRRRRADFKK